ncbi:hypothetical protein [Lacrimispora sp.]|uniref:hypothetical protein n=1 Tax=Lacrimispora sp. TaxID=2719234 RepID=UPI00345F7D14
MKIKDMAEISLLSALLLVLQIALNFLPNIELVTLFIILYTLLLGKKTLYIIYIFAVLEGIIYGFGIWWFMYLYVWTFLYFAVRYFKNNKNIIVWALLASFFGLSFGALCSIPYFLIGGMETGITWWIAGVPHDIVHGISNFVVVLVLFKPMFQVLQKQVNLD